jgi:competence protein ComEA
MRYLSLGQQKVLFVLALFLLAILCYKFYYSSPAPPEKIVKEIVVKVQGEVQKPGIYIFESPPTLKETIEKAGGLKEPVLFDKDSILEVIETGTSLNIKKESPQIPPPPPLLKGGQSEMNHEEIMIKMEKMEAHELLVFNIPLDLNRVSAEDLCLIPGVGESLAKEIVAYREKRKGFRSVEELKNIKGIGDKKHQSLKKFLIVGS